MSQNSARCLANSLSSTSSLALVLLLAAPVQAAAATPMALLDAASDVSASDAGASASDAGADASDAGASDTGANDIVVTAQHREEKLQDVPSAVSVLDKDLFSTGGVGRSANEVLGLVPNASAGTQQHGRPRWWIRGVGAGQQQLDLSNPVGFYLDEVYLSNASATGLPLFDIERVEVLRGPQGTLWGKNTTGGAINVITKRPQLSPDKQDNYVKLEYGSYDDKIVEGAVGTAIIPDKLAARVSFRVDDRGGRFTNAFTGDKSNAIKDSVIRAQILAKPSDNLEAVLSFHYRKYDTQGGYWTTASYANSGVYRSGYVPSTNINTININTPEYSNNRQIGGNLHLDYHLGGGLTLTSITGYERFDTKGQNDSDYTPLELSRGYTQAYSSQWTQELRLTSPQKGRLTWIAGLYYFNEKIHSDVYSATLPQAGVPSVQLANAPALAYSVIDYGHKAESGAAYGSATFEVTDALKLTGGLRWSRETKTLDFTRNASPNGAAASWSNLAQWWSSYTGTFGGAGVIPLTHFRPTWDALTYDVTPSFKIDRNNLVYFKYAHGVKSGGFNTAAAASPALIVVAPERLNSYEVGYKSSWLDGKLTANLTAFHYDYRNVQVNVVGPNPLVSGASVSYLQNVAKAHSDGVEFELNASPVEALKLNAAAGLLNTKFDDFQVINGGANYSGNQFVRAPHFTLNVGASYTVPLAKAGKIELEADARYQSHQYYYVNVQAAQDPGRSFLGQNGYTLANARITWTAPNEHLSASVFVNNLLDTTYINHALPAFTASSVAAVNSAPASAVLGDIVQYGDPRTWGASLIYRF